MILPVRTDSPLRSRPWMNWGIIAATILTCAYEAFTDQFHEPTWINRLELNPRVPELWTFATYAFVHAGWLHLLENVIALYILGNNINDRLGNVGYLAFYLAGAIVGGIGF